MLGLKESRWVNKRVRKPLKTKHLQEKSGAEKNRKQPRDCRDTSRPEGIGTFAAGNHPSPKENGGGAGFSVTEGGE